MTREDHRKLPEIVDEEQYGCSVAFHSKASHQILVIEAEHLETGKMLYVAFWMVKYFSGPILWQGLHIRKEPRDDGLKLYLQLMGWQNRVFPEDILQLMALEANLYTIKPIENGPEVKILAADLNLYDEPMDIELRVRLKAADAANDS